MNTTATIGTRKAKLITSVTTLLTVVAAFYGVFRVGQLGSFTQVGQWIYESAEWLRRGVLKDVIVVLHADAMAQHRLIRVRIKSLKVRGNLTVPRAND